MDVTPCSPLCRKETETDLLAGSLSPRTSCETPLTALPVTSAAASSCGRRRRCVDPQNSDPLLHNNSVNRSAEWSACAKISFRKFANYHIKSTGLCFLSDYVVQYSLYSTTFKTDCFYFTQQSTYPKTIQKWKN